MRPVACMLACFAQTSHSWQAPSSVEEVHVQEIVEEPAPAYHSSAHWRMSQGRRALAVFLHAFNPGAAWSPLDCKVGSVIGSNFNVLPNSARANKIYAARARKTSKTVVEEAEEDEPLPSFDDLKDPDNEYHTHLRLRKETWRHVKRTMQADGVLDQFRVAEDQKAKKIQALKARGAARSGSRRQGSIRVADFIQQDGLEIEKEEEKPRSHQAAKAFLNNDEIERQSIGGTNYFAGGVRRTKGGMAKMSKEMDAGLTTIEQFVPDTPADQMTVAELKEVLKNTKQRRTGTKAELIERVQDMQRNKLLGMPVLNMYAATDVYMKWYMLKVQIRFEKNVVATLHKMMKEGFDDQIEAAWVAMPEFATSTATNLNPGFVFIRCILSPGLYRTIVDMGYVLDFFGVDPVAVNKAVGKDGKKSHTMPTVIPDEEFDAVYLQTRSDPSKPFAKIYTPVGGNGKKEVQNKRLAKKNEAVVPEAYLRTPEQPAAKKPKKQIEEVQPLAVVFAKGEMMEVTQGPFTGMRGPVISDAKAWLAAKSSSPYRWQ